MLRGLGKESVRVASDKLLGIPEVKGAVFKGTSNDTSGMIVIRETPGNIVESNVVSIASLKTQTWLGLPGLGSDTGYGMEL